MLARVNDDTDSRLDDLSTEIKEAGNIKNQGLTGEVLFSMGFPTCWKCQKYSV